MTNWHRKHETYSYEILWRACMTTLDLAESKEKDVRSDHLSVQSLLSGFLAFEGFINFVGEEIAPETWKNEREFISGDKYRGIVGKVEFIFSCFNNVPLKKGEEPYQTFYRIKRIRDKLAHNKVLKYSDKTNLENPDYKTDWDEFDSPDKVRPAVMQLKAFAELIRVEAVKQLTDYYKTSHLYFQAFQGPIAHATGKEHGG